MEHREVLANPSLGEDVGGCPTDLATGLFLETYSRTLGIKLSLLSFTHRTRFQNEIPSESSVASFCGGGSLNLVRSSFQYVYIYIYICIYIYIFVHEYEHGIQFV